MHRYDPKSRRRWDPKSRRRWTQIGTTLWLAGGGIKRGASYGETDEIGFQPVKNPVQIQDLHATLLALLGIDHTRLIHPVAVDSTSV